MRAKLIFLVLLLLCATGLVSYGSRRHQRPTPAQVRAMHRGKFFRLRDTFLRVEEIPSPPEAHRLGILWRRTEPAGCDDIRKGCPDAAVGLLYLARRSRKTKLEFACRCFEELIRRHGPFVIHPYPKDSLLQEALHVAIAGERPSLMAAALKAHLEAANKNGPRAAIALAMARGYYHQQVILAKKSKQDDRHIWNDEQARLVHKAVALLRPFFNPEGKTSVDESTAALYGRCLGLLRSREAKAEYERVADKVLEKPVSTRGAAQFLAMAGQVLHHRPRGLHVNADFRKQPSARYLRRALAYYGKHDPGTTQKINGIHLDLIAGLAEEGDLDGAEEAFAPLKVSTLTGAHRWRYAYNSGVIRFKREEYGEALRHFRRSLALAPNYQGRQRLLRRIAAAEAALRVPALRDFLRK